MKKILLISTFIIGLLFIGGEKLSAKMNNEFSQVSAKHILVSTQKDAENIKKQIDAGEISFEDAAKKYSKCPSKSQGGDLGYFGRGMMVKPFEEAAFSADKNVVTQPVQTQFGWHLIKVTDKK
ncbi:peptidyl-prolyl cis-trans isomerase [bacterium]|nr:peptidyl-prolyl cis-trans isomerase [bacterium]